MVKNLPANAGDGGSIPGSGRSPGEGRGNSLQLFLSKESQGQRSLVGYSPWGCRVGHNGATEHAHIFTWTQHGTKNYIEKIPPSWGQLSVLLPGAASEDCFLHSLP